MEVHQVKDIVHVDILQINADGIGRAVRCHSVNPDMLFAAFYGKVVHFNPLVVVYDVCRTDIPCRVVNHHCRRVDSQFDGVVLVFVFIELCLCQ